MKHLFAVLLLFIGFNGLAQTPGYAIKAKINGLKDSTCYIGHYYGNNQYIAKDTAKADKQGNLTFTGKKPLPGGVYVLVTPRKYIEFLIGEQHFSFEADTANPVATMKVKNSPENTLFYSYQKYMAARGREADSLRKLMTGPRAEDPALKKQLENLDKKVLDYQQKFIADNKNMFAAKVISGALEPRIPEPPKLPSGAIDSTFAYRYFKKHYWDGFDFTDDRLSRTPFFHGRLEKYFKNLVVQHPDSINKEADLLLAKAKGSEELFKYILWHVFRTYETSPIMGMDAVMVYLAEKYYLAGTKAGLDDKTIQNIQDRVTIVKPLLLGKKAPNMLLTDSTGRMVPLYEVKAKYTIVYFWDSECGHCKTETPKLYEFYEKNKKHGLQVYAVNIERKPQGWKKYIQKHKLRNWINVQDGRTVTDFKKLYDVYSTPVVYILDENKKIIAKRIAVEHVEEYFQKNLLK